MTERLTPDEIEEILSEYSLFVGSSMKRTAIALRLAQADDPPFTSLAAQKLWAWVKSKKGVNSPEALFASLIQGDWQEALRDIEKSRKRQGQRESKERLQDKGQPRIEYATPDNPKGRPPGPNREQNKLWWDHTKPGAWNAYRGSYNGPNGEQTTTCTLYGWVGVELSPEGGPLDPDATYTEPNYQPNR